MRLLRRIGGFVFVVAMLAAAQAVVDSAPDRNHQLRAFPVAGELGTDVVARRFTARVLAVRCAARLKVGSAVLDTQGVWVIVKLRLSARSEPTSIGYAAVRDASGRIYQATDRLNQYLIAGGRRIQPGLPLEGEVAIEVPAAAAGSLTLLLATSHVDHRMDSMAEIALPIADTAAATADTTPTTVLPLRAAS